MTGNELIDKLEWLALTSGTKKELTEKLGCGRLSLNRWMNGDCEPQNKLTRAKIDELYANAPTSYDVSGRYNKYNVGDYVEIKNLKGNNEDLNGVVGVVKRVVAEKDGRTIYNIEPYLSLTPEDKQGVAKLISEDYGFTKDELRRYPQKHIDHDSSKAICQIEVDPKTSESNTDWTKEDALDEQIADLEEQLAELKAKRNANKWTFTEDEKIILRNVDKELNWLARDENGMLHVFSEKPTKQQDGWWNDWYGGIGLFAFYHLFQSVQWTDKEPCEFRKYLED